jgi:hypothetical protein
MSYVVTRSEYLTVDSVPLSTPAWETLDLSELNDGPGVRGEDFVVPQIRGSLARQRTTDARTVNIPIVIFGDKSSTGAVHANPRQGLLTNIDELKTAIRPLRRTPQVGGFTRTLTWIRPGGNVFTPVHVSTELNLQYISPTTARGVLSITLIAGVFISSTQTTINQYVDNSETFSFNVLGSAEVVNSTINIPGAANSVSIYSATTGFGIEYDLPVTTGLTILTGGFYAADGMTDVSGNITTSGTNLWMPLMPGTNTWTVTRDGAATQLMTITYRAVFL